MVRKLIFIYVLVLIPLFSIAQYKWDFGGGIGAANYLGDIGGKTEKTRQNFIKDLVPSQTHPAVTLFARKRLYPSISLKIHGSYGRISGYDSLSLNPGRFCRNLSFRNDLMELGLQGEFYIYQINDLGHGFKYRNDFKLYLFAGAAVLYHNPKAFIGGNWVALQPLGTEGQGVLPGTQKYGLFQATLPVGAGFYFTLDKVNRIGWELGWRSTFTDYLDDVSTTYASPEVFKGNQTAIDLANRTYTVDRKNSTMELPSVNSYAPGEKRGDPSHNDSYIFSTITYSYVIKGKSKFGKKRYNTYFKKNKYKRRKIRAKF